MPRYSMTPLGNGTRLRTDHNTFASTITSYNRGQLIVGDEVWEAPADGTEVKRGDKWLHVISVDGVNLVDRGWMAYIHKGVAYCNNFQQLPDPEPDPDPTKPMFPESFILTDPSGARAEYVFIRVIEE